MYFDSRLWAFTHGVRGRIAWSVLIGLVAAFVGLARLALLGWLIAKVFQGAAWNELLLPITVVALVMSLRGIFEYVRTMVAHRTAARAIASLSSGVPARLELLQLFLISDMPDKIERTKVAFLSLQNWQLTSSVPQGLTVF